MPKRSGAKSKGRGKDSDYRKGYQTGWKRIQKGAKKRVVTVSEQSREYQKGYRAGVAAAKRFYRRFA